MKIYTVYLTKVTDNDVNYIDGNWYDIDGTRPGPGQREKIKSRFFFTLLCGTSKCFMKAFIKPFEAPQRIVKIKI